jgi:hypothetical protein
MDEWSLQLTAEQHLAPSTIRSYQCTLRQFTEFLIGGRYGWAVACEQAFGPGRHCPCRKPHLCRSGGMLILVEDSAESILSADARAGQLVRMGDRRGQRAGVREALVGTVPVEMVLVLTHYCAGVLLVVDLAARGRTW